MSSSSSEPDVVAMVAPQTGAKELDIADPGNPDVTLPIALYQAERLDREGVKTAEPAVLFRFRPTLEQRHKILQGEDLYLLMLLPNERSPLPIELTVGPGPLQLEATPAIVVPALWTPEQGAS